MNIEAQLPKLETKHVTWIFSAAGETYEKHIAETELEIMRHEHFKDEPLARSGPVPKERTERIAELREYLRQYRNIVAVCKVMRERAIDLSAAEFAESFKGAFSR